MTPGYHVVKRSPQRWEVRGPAGKAATSVHRTQANAVAAARRLALRSGGGEVVLHGADGQIRDVDTVGAARLDERKGRGRVATEAQSRAPRSEGPRTTLRLPPTLAEAADRLARELEISRNDALLRLATRGAQLYELEQTIAARRQARWAAVVPGAVDIDRADLPSPDEARDAILTLPDPIPSAEA